MTTLQVTIHVDERAISPARLVSVLTRAFTGFQTHNRLSDEQLQLDISSFKVESIRRKGNG